ncbi:MAG: hypothetical protein P8016_08780 [Sedimentisphaerales bacterium]
MMCKKMIYLMFVFVLCFICTSYASAQIIYVDATEGEAGNTTLADGGFFNSTEDASGSDNLWRGRAFGNSATIFESGGSYGETANPEDCPRLKTSVEVPEGDYKVYVYFWSDGSPWCVQASLTDSEGDLPLYVAGQGDTTTAAAENFSEPVPMLTEGNRTLWQASLGSTGSTTTIDVYIDDFANHMTHNSRTWYDGIGYEEIVPQKIWREAEAADSITTPLQVVNDVTASGGNYIVASSVANNSNPPSTGIAKYSVEITEEAVYRMYLRVRCETAGSNDDSCYVRIRGASLNLTGLNNGWISDNNIDYQIPNSTDWFWKQVGNYASEPGNDYAEFTMTPGTYTVEIAYREDGLDIDGFLLTNATDIDPAALPDEIPVGPLVIGDFEDGLDGWWRWYDSNCTMAVGTVGATSGSSSLDLTVDGGYYQIAWSAPTGYGLDLSNVTTLQLDATMLVSDFPDGTWTKIDQIALNSELGWRQMGPTLVFDNDTSQEVPSLDWGTWSGDSHRTITWDIAAQGWDWTGFGDSSYQEVVISAMGNGVFHLDNIRLNGAQLIAKPLYPLLKLDINASDDSGQTQGGFTPLVLVDSNSVTIDDITLTFGGYDPADASRLSEPNDLENEDIYRDFILAEQSEPGVGYVTLTLEGLEPNAPYNIKIYSWDGDISGLTVTDWLANYEYLLTTTQDGNSVPPAADDQAFCAYANADPNGVILLEAVPGEGTDPNEPFAVLNALVLSALHAPPVTTEVTSDADTWTVSGDPNSHGMDEYMVIHGGSAHRTGYVRFDLSGLDIDSIENAALTLSVHGSIPKPPYRNDSVVSGRFALYGLNNVAGNTPQDWGEDVLTSADTGAEMDWATGSVVTDGGLATDLDDDVEGISETYSASSSPANASLGATITISGDALVSFLQSRVGDDGLVTFILKDDDGADRGYGLCSREYPDQTYWPQLELEYLEK